MKTSTLARVIDHPPNPVFSVHRGVRFARLSSAAGLSGSRDSYLRNQLLTRRTRRGVCNFSSGRDKGNPLSIKKLRRSADRVVLARERSRESGQLSRESTTVSAQAASFTVVITDSLSGYEIVIAQICAADNRFSDLRRFFSYSTPSFRGTTRRVAIRESTARDRGVLVSPNCTCLAEHLHFVGKDCGLGCPS